MMILGTVQVIGSISPYIASYFRVPTSDVLILLPSTVLLQTVFSPLGGKLASTVQPKLLMAFGGCLYLTGLYMASQVPRDSFRTFFVLYVGGLGSCLGFTYILPIKLAWIAFPSKPGLVSGIAIGGFGLGVLVFNQVSSMLCNPMNLQQEEFTDAQTQLTSKRFPDEVALRVPYMLKGLVLSYATIICIAMFLLWDVQGQDGDQVVGGDSEDDSDYIRDSNSD